MPKVFISYRRDDTLPYAGRLCDALMAEFGDDNVFMDIADISPGRDFAAVLEEAIAACDVMLVLMGRQWLSITGPTEKRRLDDPDDFVRQEVSTALKRKIMVVPVLVQNIPVPRVGELPDDMANLVRHQACELSDTRWRHDVDRLISAISTSSASAKIIFKQSDPERRKRDSHIKEVRLLQESDNLLDLEIDYKHNGVIGTQNIVIWAEAFNVRGNEAAFAGSYPPVGIGEGTVRLRLKVTDVWLPLNTVNLGVGFYERDEANHTSRYLDGEDFSFNKTWK